MYQFFEPPAVPGFGAAGGISLRVLDKTNTMNYKQLGEETEKFLAALEKRKNEILRALRGDQALRQRNMNVPPAISERVGEIVNAQRMSTAQPTQTQLDQYAVAARDFDAALTQLRQLIEGDLAKLEKQMEAAGAPWTPGRIPEWRDQ